MFERKIRWGIFGAGDIVRGWIKGARQVSGMEIAAIASRTAESTSAAAAELHIPEALSYEELAAREDIDVIYIAVPHNAHKELALLALEGGRHVLLEKPAAVSAAEFEEIAGMAKKRNRFLMEAVWMRFFPIMESVLVCIDSGEIGEVRMIQSSFGFRADPGAGSGRLFDPGRAGGSLLDIGVYNLHFADMVLRKEPLKITGLASFNTDEPLKQVDEQAGYIARYSHGELAVMISAIRTDLSDTARIYGTKGRIEVPFFWKPEEMRIVTEKGTRTVRKPVKQRVRGILDEGYQYEIAHVNDCIRKGLTESPLMSWENSRKILRQCDHLRREWDFIFPFE